jgi:hypothetical protein
LELLNQTEVDDSRYNFLLITIRFSYVKLFQLAIYRIGVDAVN